MLNAPELQISYQAPPYNHLGPSHTTRLTYLCAQVNQLPAQDPKALGTVLAYLEEALQPPDLEDALAGQDDHLEDAPPLDAAVGALCGVAVRSFAYDDVGLFVFDLGEEFGELSD